MSTVNTEESSPASETPTPATTMPAGAGNTSGPRIRLDDSNMKSCYANFANVNSNREETVLLFGMHHAWAGGQKEIEVQLSNRIVMSPYAAKRLATLLNNVLREHESRFGALSTEPVVVRPGVAQGY
jgi:Protein of unknown function (DUF3467)